MIGDQSAGRKDHQINITKGSSMNKLKKSKKENMDMNKKKKCGYSNKNMNCLIDLSSNELYISCENK
jgi:hypothetical protein